MSALSFLNFFFLDYFFFPSLKESESLEESELEEEEESEYDDEDDEEPRSFFFFILDNDFRADFASALSMRPCFAKRRTMPSSVFLSAFSFVRLESFSASFSMKLAASFVIRGVVEFPIDMRRPPDLEAPFFPLVLVITCLYEHRSTGGIFHTYRVACRLGGEGSSSRHRRIRAFVLEGFHLSQKRLFTRGATPHSPVRDKNGPVRV